MRPKIAQIGALLISSVVMAINVGLVYGQGFNVASTYPIGTADAVSGDILVNGKSEGFVTSSVAYDSGVFGILQDDPIMVLRQASAGATLRPVIAIGDTVVNVNDYNGEIKKGDYVTTSPQKGKGMKAEGSGYVVGIALEDAKYGNQTISIDNKQIRNGTVVVTVKPEYAELTTARNYNSLLTKLNDALFKQIQNPERFTLIIRYLLAGLVGLIAFTVGFLAVTRSISNATEAIGRNPLARNSILASLGIQIAVAVIGAVVAVGIVILILRG